MTTPRQPPDPSQPQGTSSTHPKALVTGAGGFLGGALVRALLQAGHPVRALVRRDPGDLAGAEILLGDIRDREAMRRACEGIDVVFHTAAKAGGWGDPAEYEAINVGGTENLLAASYQAGVSGFVYTSSPSVVFDRRAIQGGDESLPYASRYLAHYPRTKALAEQKVLATRGVRTVSLRPHLIWGPGDRHLLPRLVSRAGKLKRVGPGDPLTDTIYLDNCVHAHLLAAARLLEEQSPLPGKAYFISDDAPMGMWTMANRMLQAAGAPLITGEVSVAFAHAAAFALEAVHHVFRRGGEPLLTRFAVSQFAHAQWYDIAAARRDLGYRPIVTVDEGLRRLEASLVEA